MLEVKTEHLFKAGIIDRKTISEALRYSVKGFLGTVNQHKPVSRLSPTRIQDTQTIHLEKIRPAKFPLKNEDMKSTKPLIGLTVDKDEPKEVYLNSKAHTLVCGMTQGGKTTAVEGVLSRWDGKKVIVCICKPGEQAFRGYRKTKPLFKTRSDWIYAQSLMEVELREKNKGLRPVLIETCKDAHSLEDVLKNTIQALENHKYRTEHERTAYILLKAYLEPIVSKMAKHSKYFANELDIKEGINVMDLQQFGPELQSVVVGSIAQEILDGGWKDVVLAVPEAWEVVPNNRSSPAKLQVEALIRKGAINGNVVVMDTQDLVSIHAPLRRQTANIMVGRQSEPKEIERSLKHFPNTGQLSYTDIFHLSLGQFYTLVNGEPKRVFAIPSWMNFGDALECSITPEYVYEVLRRRQNT